MFNSDMSKQLIDMLSSSSNNITPCKDKYIYICITGKYIPH